MCELLNTQMMHLSVGNYFLHNTNTSREISHFDVDYFAKIGKYVWITAPVAQWTSALDF